VTALIGRAFRPPRDARPVSHAPVEKSREWFAFGPPPYSVARPVGRARVGGIVQRDLVERAQRGDHDAFAALADAAIGRLDTAARLVLRDPDRAKDVVQNTLIRVWRDLPGLRDPDRFNAWTHRVLVRACYDELRRTRRRVIEVELTSLDYTSVGDTTVAMAARDELERGFHRLDADQRLVVVLHYYLDLPLPEVAATLGIPLGTAQSRLHRGLAALRRMLGAHGERGLLAEEAPQ
jgi:RNA polymerase sigma-70 factor, ECF subfamily